MKDDCCERCERLIADLRAEQLRELRRVKEIVEDVVAKNSALLTNVEQRNLGWLADVDRRVQRLFDTLSERLHLSPRPMNEEPPRMH